MYFVKNPGYPATTLPLLGEKSTDIKISVSEASWFASVTAISSPIGGLISGYFLEKLGRKRTLLCINLISIISWLIIAFSSKNDAVILFVQLMVARTIIGKIWLNFDWGRLREEFCNFQESQLVWVARQLLFMLRKFHTQTFVEDLRFSPLSAQL